MVSAGYGDEDRIELEPWWGFTNWRIDSDPIRSGLDWILEGFAFDVEQNGLWKPAWGPRAEAEEARRRRLAEVLGAAPRLVPVYGNHFLVGEPCRAGNPVLLIHQSQIYAYGADLRAHLIERHAKGVSVPFDNGREAARRVPFWGEFVD